MNHNIFQSHRASLKTQAVSGLSLSLKCSRVNSSLAYLKHISCYLRYLSSLAISNVCGVEVRLKLGWDCCKSRSHIVHTYCSLNICPWLSANGISDTSLDWLAYNQYRGGGGCGKGEWGNGDCKEKRRKKTVGVAAGAAAARNVQGNGNAKGKGNAKEGRRKWDEECQWKWYERKVVGQGAGQEAKPAGAELSGQTDNNQNG